MSTDLYDDLYNCGHHKYELGSVSHSLRAIRNKYTHYGKLSSDLQVQLGTIPDSFYSYYIIIYNYWKDDENFQRYFKGDDYPLSLSRTSSMMR